MEQWCALASIERHNASTAFSICNPGLWRGKSNFSPVLAALNQKLLGPNWYEQIYEDPLSLWLTHETFQRWQQHPKVRQVIAHNLRLCLDSPKFLSALSVLGWSKLLQSAYDFDHLDLFQHLWKQALQRPWSPDELALLYSIY